MFYGALCCLHISQLECYNVLVTLRIFATSLKGKSICIWCDNLATVEIFNSGKSKDQFMSSCLREAWFLCSISDVNLKVSHKSGATMEYADMLSRVYNSDSEWNKFVQFRTERSEAWLKVCPRTLISPTL